MDIEKYTKIELQGMSTLLITAPGGFDPETGAALPPKDQGFQPDTLKDMRKSAVDAVIATQEALAKAEARLAKLDEVLAHPEVAKAEANIAAFVEAEKARIAAEKSAKETA